MVSTNQSDSEEKELLKHFPSRCIINESSFKGSSNERYYPVSKMFRVNPQILSALREHDGPYSPEKLKDLNKFKGTWYGVTILNGIYHALIEKYGGDDTNAKKRLNYCMLVYALRTGGIKLAMAKPLKGGNSRCRNDPLCPVVFVSLPYITEKTSDGATILHGVYTLSVHAGSVSTHANGTLDTDWDQVIKALCDMTHTNKNNVEYIFDDAGYHMSKEKIDTPWILSSK